MRKSENATGSDPAASIAAPVPARGQRHRALGLGAIATAFLEPDPGFTWDVTRAAAISHALAAAEQGVEPPGEGSGRSG